MERLPETIKKNGFEYHLMERTEGKAVYSQNYPSVNSPVGFEVFIIVRQPYSKRDLPDGRRIEYKAKD